MRPPIHFLSAAPGIWANRDQIVWPPFRRLKATTSLEGPCFAPATPAHSRCCYGQSCLTSRGNFHISPSSSPPHLVFLSSSDSTTTIPIANHQHCWGHRQLPLSLGQTAYSATAALPLYNGIIGVSRLHCPSWSLFPRIWCSPMRLKIWTLPASRRPTLRR